MLHLPDRCGGVVTRQDLWNVSDNLAVGDTSFGTLNVTDAGVVNNTSASIGDGSSVVGLATINRANSQWNNSVNLTAAAGFQETIETGPILCLGIGNVRRVLTERVIRGPQPSVFRAVGSEPFEAKVVVLKTGIGYKMTYAHVAKAVLRADCPGAQSYNLKNYLFEHVARPIFPLDGEFDWHP